jgi:uncharacterized protein (TIGR00295 family)
MNAFLPTPDQCVHLLKKAGCSNEVILHCKAVRDVALKIAEKTHADSTLVEVGALLHDIGRSQSHGIRHGVVGAEIARQYALPEKIIRIIERHLGGGIPKQEAIRLGLPPKDYIPVTLEEKIVAHADNLIDHAKKQPIQHEIQKALDEGMDRLAERLRSLHTELSNLAGIDLDEL